MSDARIDQAKGDVKTATGKLTGDRDLEAQGRAESTTAGLRKDAGQAMDQAKRSADDTMDKARDVARDVQGKAQDVADDVADKAHEVMSR